MTSQDWARIGSTAKRAASRVSCTLRATIIGGYRVEHGVEVIKAAFIAMVAARVCRRCTMVVR
ncbi:uncharacterized protein SCHCODRAFT_02635629 [Schizophyllum commune H4-8]|uniref:uncharacterized protein n=1 Tax=Schizophyllum commune (strain H4-8 / FGSC 9210) TaxID=578458 RepID=UPI00215F2A8A|nr:uncharacterized protein SCHCODRAFT_02635629 [Schizophyllum commune H4-8]KAI5889788.1 hypothetical protein SCHCODRAFT_02635629 [Schizophyllum commune H4-8]